jgi:hypothetical protein
VLFFTRLYLVRRGVADVAILGHTGRGRRLIVNAGTG